MQLSRLLADAEIATHPTPGPSHPGIAGHPKYTRLPGLRRHIANHQQSTRGYRNQPHGQHKIAVRSEFYRSDQCLLTWAPQHPREQD